MAKHIKKKHCLGNSYVEKSIIFGFLEKIGLRALILMIAFWEILIELGQLVGQKLGRKHNKKKPLDFLHTFRHICYFVGDLCIIDHHKTKKLKIKQRKK